MTEPIFRVVAVTVPVRDLDAGIAVEAAGGRVLTPSFDIPVGRVAVVGDPFGNVLVLVDLSKGRYETDAEGRVTGVRR